MKFGIAIVFEGENQKEGKMKNHIKSKILIAVLSIFFIFTACNSPIESSTPSNSEDIISILKSMEVEDISQPELDGLIFMREEEKLAHDVYVVLYEKWGQKVFNNISQSEQRHTDAVKALLEKYAIDDPVANDEFGTFQNSELQALYNSLIETGSESLVAALKVGAAIEEIDILDLEKRLNENDNADIKFVYENLKGGSENHLRAFVRNLNAQGVDYQAQYLDQTQFDTILASSNKMGNKRG